MSAKKPSLTPRLQRAKKEAPARTKAALELIFPERQKADNPPSPESTLRTIDLFCGAGGITELMINWIYFPKSSPVPEFGLSIINLFEECAHAIDSASNSKQHSDAVMERLRLGLE